MPLRASAISWSKPSWLNGTRLGRALHLDDAARSGHDEVGVRIGLGILGVVEVEHGVPL